VARQIERAKHHLTRLAVEIAEARQKRLGIALVAVMARRDDEIERARTGIAYPTQLGTGLVPTHRSIGEQSSLDHRFISRWPRKAHRGCTQGRVMLR